LINFMGAAMSNSQHTDFSKFVPGFDFLQGLAKGHNAQVPGMPSWIAPTLDPQELDKRIGELKSVQYWLDQNATALKATIQALEVQKMTLATLKSMNMDMGAMGKAFNFPSTSAKPAADSGKASDKSAKAHPAVDPMQLWGSLTQQFQQIATGAMQEVARHAAVAPQTATPAASPGPAKKKAAAPKASKKSAARSG
jgi:hypothetical protein